MEYRGQKTRRRREISCQDQVVTVKKDRKHVGVILVHSGKALVQEYKLGISIRVVLEVDEGG